MVHTHITELLKYKTPGQEVLRYVYKQYFNGQVLITGTTAPRKMRRISSRRPWWRIPAGEKAETRIGFSFKTYFYSLSATSASILERNRIRFEFSDLDEYIIMEEPELYDIQGEKSIYQKHFLQLTNYAGKSYYVYR